MTCIARLFMIWPTVGEQLAVAFDQERFGVAETALGEQTSTEHALGICDEPVVILEEFAPHLKRFPEMRFPRRRTARISERLPEDDVCIGRERMSLGQCSLGAGECGTC